jgi:hypothetical protein
LGRERFIGICPLVKTKNKQINKQGWRKEEVRGGWEQWGPVVRLNAGQGQQTQESEGAESHEHLGHTRSRNQNEMGDDGRGS